MRLLVFGQTGQVAREVARLAPEALCLSRAQADLTDAAACTRAIVSYAPDAVINAAAWTAVDPAEKEEALATAVNGIAPTAMAHACAKLAIPLVHISTDYVFDGAGNTPFAPVDRTAPVNAYGRSKLRGEKGVVEAGGTYAVLRTSWVFSAHGHNFVKTMLRLGADHKNLKVVADQIGGPTPARALALACLLVSRELRQDRTKSGIYHFSGWPDTSWAMFARAIMAQAGVRCQIADIPTSSYPTPARRPLNSRLDCAGLSAFGLVRPDWRVALKHVIDELEEGK